MTSYPIRSSLITLFYTAIVFHVQSCAFVLQAPRSAYSYHLSYILYIAGFIVYGRVKSFSFKICYEYTVVPHGGSLATRQMVYLLIYCYICIFNNIFHTGYIMDNHDNDILEAIGGLDKNSLNNILNNKYSPSTDMVEGEDLSSSLKHYSYYDTKSFSSFFEEQSKFIYCS